MVGSESEGKYIEYINKYSELDKNEVSEKFKNRNSNESLYFEKYKQKDDIILNDSTKYKILFSYLKKKEKKKLIQSDGDNNIILQKDIFSSKTSDLVQIFSENLIKYNINLEIYNDKLYISLKFKDKIDPLIPYLKKEFFFKAKTEENVILLLAKKFEIYNTLMKSMYLKHKVNEYFKNNKKINDFFLNNNFEKNIDTYSNIVNTTFFSNSYNVNKLFKNNINKFRTEDKNIIIASKNGNEQRNDSNNVSEIKGNALSKKKTEQDQSQYLTKCYIKNNNNVELTKKTNQSNNNENFDGDIEHGQSIYEDSNKQSISISYNLLLEKNKNEFVNLNLKKRKTEKYISKEEYGVYENDNLKDIYKNQINDNNTMEKSEKEYFKINNIENIEQIKKIEIKMCETKEERRKLKEQMKLEKNEFLRIQKEEKKRKKEKKMLERKKMLELEKAYKKKLKEEKKIKQMQEKEREKQYKKFQREEKKKLKKKILKNQTDKTKQCANINNKYDTENNQYTSKINLIIGNDDNDNRLNEKPQWMEIKSPVKKKKIIIDMASCTPNNNVIEKNNYINLSDNKVKFSQTNDNINNISSYSNNTKRKKKLNTDLIYEEIEIRNVFDEDGQIKKKNILNNNKKIKINKNDHTQVYHDLVDTQGNDTLNTYHEIANLKNEYMARESDGLLLENDQKIIETNTQQKNTIEEKEIVTKIIKNNISYNNDSISSLFNQNQENNIYINKNKKNGIKSKMDELYHQNEMLNLKNTSSFQINHAKKMKGNINVETTNEFSGTKEKIKKDVKKNAKKKDVIHIPNNVIDKKIAMNIMAYKEETNNKETKKKIALFGQVKPRDIIKRGIYGYKAFQNNENLYVDVLIIGGGISGLAASYYLKKCNAKFLCIEGRNRIGGRAFTTQLPKRIVNNKVLPETIVDLGANYLHCCDNSDLLNENKKKKVKKKYTSKNSFKFNYTNIRDHNNINNIIKTMEIDEIEKNLENSISQFTEGYEKLIKEFIKPPIYKCSNSLNNNKDCVNIDNNANFKDENDIECIQCEKENWHSDFDYIGRKKEKDLNKKKLKKNILFMIRNNVDNICEFYENYYYKNEKKDIYQFFKIIDENIYFYANLSDDNTYSIPNKNKYNHSKIIKNKQLKVLTVNKDTRKRREYDKSVTKLAEKLKPKIALVCGKDNWESTFYAYWYNNENGKKIKNFKIYRMNLLCDKIRIRAARKIKNYLFINDDTYDNQYVTNKNDAYNADSIAYNNLIFNNTNDNNSNNNSNNSSNNNNSNNNNNNLTHKMVDNIDDNTGNANSNQTESFNSFKNEYSNKGDTEITSDLYIKNEKKEKENFNIYHNRVNEIKNNFQKYINNNIKLLNPHTTQEVYNSALKKDSLVEYVDDQFEWDEINGINKKKKNAKEKNNEEEEEMCENDKPNNNINENTNGKVDIINNSKKKSIGEVSELKINNGNNFISIKNRPKIKNSPNSKSGNIKTKNLTTNLDTLFYDKNAIIYDNYYNYGEEYYNIVKEPNKYNEQNKKKKYNINDTCLYKNVGSNDNTDNEKSCGKINKKKKKKSMWDLLMECTEEIFTEMDLNQENYSIEEWKMLMVALQSRYGYGGDLRNTSIAMSRLPSSGYMDIDICPNYGSKNYILKNMKYYDKIKKNEQVPHICQFKDNTSADKIVLDGWKWIIDYLSENIQNNIFINTVAELVQIKNPTNSANSNRDQNHIYIKSDSQNEDIDDNNCKKNASNSNHNSLQSYQYDDYNSAKQKNENIEFVKEKNNEEIDDFLNHQNFENFIDNKNCKKINENDKKRNDDSYVEANDNEYDYNSLKKEYKIPSNYGSYSAIVKCKCYDTSEKNVNKNFHGTSDLSNCKFKNINIHAKYIIVALPLGCLKENEEKKKNQIQSCLKFEPELHPLKIKALSNYKMGRHNKIILRFYPFNFIWPFDGLQINCIDQKFQYLNLHAYGKIGCILVHCFPPWSSTYGYIKKEYSIVNECLYNLSKMYENSGKKLPILVDYIITKWQDDTFSCGSYAYPDYKCNDNDIIYLRAPHPIHNPKVVFCGEYLSKSYFQCVDGAYDTGIRAAEDIAHIGLKLKSFDKKKYNTDIYFFPNDTCPFTNIPLPKVKRELLGFYITDGSDEALSDYESSSGEEDDTISNIPLSIIKEERNLLYSTLKNINNFFHQLKDENIRKRKNLRGNCKKKVRDNRISQTGIKIKNIKAQTNCMNNMSNLNGIVTDDSKNCYIKKSNTDLHYDDGCNKKELNNYDNSHKLNEQIIYSQYVSSNEIINLSHNIIPIKNNTENDISFAKYINSIDFYLDRYVIKFRDIIFHNYNGIELGNICDGVNVTKDLIKIGFSLSQSLPIILKRFDNFQFIIQKELCTMLKKVTPVLLPYFNNMNDKKNEFLSIAETHLNYILTSKEVINEIFYEQIKNILEKNNMTSQYSNNEDIDLSPNQYEETIYHNRNNYSSKEYCIIKNNVVEEDEKTGNNHIFNNDINNNINDVQTNIIYNKIILNDHNNINNADGNLEKHNNNYEQKIINENAKNDEKNTNPKGNINCMQLDMNNEKKKNMYIQNKQIYELNNYLKYVLNNIFMKNKYIEEYIANTNKNKIKLNSTCFLFFCCYVLQYIMKQINYDLSHKFSDFNIIIQLLCDYVYYLIFYKHEVLCYKCMNSGELILCDFLNCTNGWHYFCLFSKNDQEEKKLNNLWFCPNCLNGKLVKPSQRGYYNQNEIIQNYWKRRVYIYKIKFFLSRTRRIRKRLDLLEMELNKRIP
ncbi:lysine-specific histone demethylase 1, putative [Plasmodium berghei]|uniref:Lysine-specific histone demethylase 1, putative n=2 Tax=Plasmodium berghei TaxID=5821 RepID=A0A509AHS5_PLABA|nr:lysine-specific histone demethylase 1, putative [Plasmodium berghei ANKA]CXI17529.1 lysine-specific histone demethylase 1, putative [Plasmodium berghei]SCM19707.1 lysine-specific histone demethylase 1, putative [Plasmodium berghei]SCN23453.1 lysine-specific histone demethylase 1, putative [Plasmodium berghei]SCO59088.1 lysine-specific histone demethylase 1, putative [Plasmodium berghei]SCO59741.1 lysine-specific histone demethylase 1, putative [Plasmodium berghei]|eukprot:XP_034420601.1 lysine-specific histone demethylase 1, putative [Plasmodium berghei ANKA]